MAAFKLQAISLTLFGPAAAVPAAPVPEERRIEEEMHTTPQQRAEATAAAAAEEGGQEDVPSDAALEQKQLEPKDSAVAQDGAIALVKVSVQQTTCVAVHAVSTADSAAAKTVQSKVAGGDERWPMDGTPNLLPNPKVRAPAAPRLTFACHKSMTQSFWCLSLRSRVTYPVPAGIVAGAYGACAELRCADEVGGQAHCHFRQQVWCPCMLCWCLHAHPSGEP